MRTYCLELLYGSEGGESKGAQDKIGLLLSPPMLKSPLLKT